MPPRPAVEPSRAEQSACADCGKPLVGKRADAHFCSTRCRTRAAKAAERQRKRQDNGPHDNIMRSRRITAAAAILHPGEPERPFLSAIDEPSWLAAELRPPRLDCEG
jgi:hypothetical protein